MRELIEKIENSCRLILDDKIPEDSFNKFCVDFYIDLQNLPQSFSSFCKVRNLRSPKFSQIKIAGEFLYLSRNNYQVRDMLIKNGFNEMPQLNKNIAFYAIRKNQFTLEQNWENIISVLKEKELATKVVEKRKNNFSDAKKAYIKENVMSNMKITPEQYNWLEKKLIEMIKNEPELFFDFKIMLKQKSEEKDIVSDNNFIGFGF